MMVGLALPRDRHLGQWLVIQNKRKERKTPSLASNGQEPSTHPSISLHGQKDIDASARFSSSKYNDDGSRKKWRFLRE